MAELPKIISVDDHVVEPPHTWQRWLPARFRDQGPRVELNWVDGSVCFPTFPRFCGQAFPECADRALGLACIEAYNNFMVEEQCADSGGVLIPPIIA